MAKGREGKGREGVRRFGVPLNKKETLYYADLASECWIFYSKVSQLYKIFRGRMLPLGVPYHEYPASVPGNDYVYSLPSITVLTFIVKCPVTLS